MTTLAPPATIAFIGLGMMGRPMAARLAEAGYKLRLFDISQKAVSDFICAHAMKALNNYLSAAGLVALCEALVVGEAFGLDPGTMVDVFNSSTGKSNATEVKGRQFVVSRTFAAGFTTGLMAKDLRTAGDVAEHLELNMPNLQQAVAYWTDADGKLGK